MNSDMFCPLINEPSSGVEKNRISSGTRFLTGYENRSFLPLLRSTGEKGANFESRKKLCSSKFF